MHAHMYMHGMCAVPTEAREELSDSLELELQTVDSCQVGGVILKGNNKIVPPPNNSTSRYRSKAAGCGP